MSYDALWDRYQRSMMQSQELRRANGLLAGHDEDNEQALEEFRFGVGGGGGGSLGHGDGGDEDVLFAAQSMASEEQHDMFGGDGDRHSDYNEQKDLVNICTDINDLLGRHGHPYVAPANNHDDNAAEEEEMAVEQRANDTVDEPNFFVNSPPCMPVQHQQQQQQPEQAAGGDDPHYVYLLLRVVQRATERQDAREAALAARNLSFDADIEAFRQQRAKDNDPIHRLTLHLGQARAEMRAAQMRQLSSDQVKRMVRHLDHLVVLADVACASLSSLNGATTGSGLYHARLGPYLMLVFGDDEKTDSYIITHEDYLS